MIGVAVRIPDGARAEPELVRGLLTAIEAGKEEDLPDGVQAEDVMGLDRSWLTLQELLVGSGEEEEGPDGFLGTRGEAVEGFEGGPGLVQTISAEQVVELRDFLAALDQDELQGRLELRQRGNFDIYPQFWKDVGVRDLEWPRLNHALARMTEFLGSAVDEGKALLICLD